MANKFTKKKNPVSDTKQVIKLVLLSFSELFKIIMATLLILFVPQKCDTLDCNPDLLDNSQQCEPHECSIKEIIVSYDKYTKAILFFNFITLIIFIVYYGIEMYRETLLIKYLDIDNNFSDNYLPTILHKYPQIKQKINGITKVYYYKSCVLVFFIIINFILSLVCVMFHYSDLKSLTSIVSFSVLTINKIYNSYYISKKAIKKNIYESAYMTEFASFNIIDVDWDNLEEKLETREEKSEAYEENTKDEDAKNEDSKNENSKNEDSINENSKNEDSKNENYKNENSKEENIVDIRASSI